GLELRLRDERPEQHDRKQTDEHQIDETEDIRPPPRQKSGKTHQRRRALQGAFERIACPRVAPVAAPVPRPPSPPVPPAVLVPARAPPTVRPRRPRPRSRRYVPVRLGAGIAGPAVRSISR